MSKKKRQPMTVQDAIARLGKIANSLDPEAAHGDADNVLLEYLRDNGGEAVAKAWGETCTKVGFWYA